MESAIRNCDGFQVKQSDVENILDWEKKQSENIEVPFKPVRVLLQDLTGNNSPNVIKLFWPQIERSIIVLFSFLQVYPPSSTLR